MQPPRRPRSPRRQRLPRAPLPHLPCQGIARAASCHAVERRRRRPRDWARRLGQSIATMSHGRTRIVADCGVADGLEAVRAGNADLYFGNMAPAIDAHRALAYSPGSPVNAAWLQAAIADLGERRRRPSAMG